MPALTVLSQECQGRRHKAGMGEGPVNLYAALSCTAEAALDGTAPSKLRLSPDKQVQKFMLFGQEIIIWLHTEKRPSHKTPATRSTSITTSPRNFIATTTPRLAPLARRRFSTIAFPARHITIALGVKIDYGV